MPRQPIRFGRAHAVRRLRRQLEEQSFPRLQMGLIVGLTGAMGLLCSYLLLQAGIDSMALRNPLALAAAYLFFMFLLWLWLRTNAEDYVELPDLTGLAPSRTADGVSLPPFRSGEGGDFGGGGASASFDAPADGALEPLSESLPSVGEAAGATLEADEFAIPLLAIVLAIGLAVASLYVVYIAPALFAELLFDGVLSYSLYRHMRLADARHWLETAIRRTVWPFVLTGVFVAAVGWALAAYTPGARSIGEAVRHHSSAR